MLAGVPPVKKMQSFEQLEGLRRTMQAAEEGHGLVNSANNVRLGKRPRIKTTTQPGYIKTTPLSQSPEALAARKAKEMKAAEEARAAEVKSSQIDLARHLYGKWIKEGVNTPGWQRKAMMKAIEINPATATPPPMGQYKLPYKSGAQVWEGAPLSEWFELASEDILPYGPNALWRKWEKPLQSALNWDSMVGPVITSDGIGASKASLEMLGQGLAEMAPYLKKKGGVLSAKSGDSVPYNGMISQGKEFNAWQRYLSNHPMTGHKLRKAKTLALDAARLIPRLDVIMSAYDLYNSGMWDWSTSKMDKLKDVATAAGGAGSLLRWGFEKPFMNIGEPELSRMAGTVGRVASAPYKVMSAIKFIDDFAEPVQHFKNGSKIHIKKANRGKFTDYCGGKVTSECIARGKASSNPAIRKRATFAANARKWKHQNGGKIMPYWVYNILGGE